MEILCRYLYVVRYIIFLSTVNYYYYYYCYHYYYYYYYYY